MFTPGVDARPKWASDENFKKNPAADCYELFARRLSYFEVEHASWSDAKPGRSLPPGEHLCQPLFGRPWFVGERMTPAYFFMLRVAIGRGAGTNIEIMISTDDSEGRYRAARMVESVGLLDSVLKKQIVFSGGLVLAEVVKAEVFRPWVGSIDFGVRKLRLVTGPQDLPAGVNQEDLAGLKPWAPSLMQPKAPEDYYRRRGRYR